MIFGTVFSGSTTASGGFVKRYLNGSYPGYNFTNTWSVNAPGIPQEDDDTATANVFFTGAPIVTLGNAAIKLPVTTNIIRPFRVSSRSGVNSDNSIMKGKSLGLSMYLGQYPLLLSQVCV